ncbi:MAG: dipeptide ABC transporter ATP-binding protein [Granulosicoccus sp.]
MTDCIVKAKTQSVLEVHELNVSFATESGPLHAVRGLSFSLSAGETLAIVGESGSGKSATAMALMGLQASSTHVSGSILLHGEQLVDRDDHSMSRLRGNSIAMVFQDPLASMTPVYTIGEQIIESIQIHDTCSTGVARERAIDLLRLVGIPEPEQRVHAYPHEFSGGMRQRVLIAMAVANNPDVIIADEPTTALDVTIQAQVLDVLQKACEETQAALLLITHDLGVVARVADKALVMYAGRVVEEGDVWSLFHHSRMPYTMGLLGSLPGSENAKTHGLSAIEGNPPSLFELPTGCPFSPRCPLVTDACLSEEPALVRVGGSKQFTACIRHDVIELQSLTHTNLFQSQTTLAESSGIAAPEGNSKVLEMSSVKQHFPLLEGAVFRRRVGTVHAVDGIDLHVRKGETLGLVGESGCGKSTTSLSILDLKPPTDGTIRLFGIDVRKIESRSQQLAVRRQLQIVFQDPMSSLDPRMPVYDLIAEPMGVFDYSAAAIATRVNELVALVGLDRIHLERFPQQLSGGQCQRVCIARALVLEPQLLVLDEPVSALDVSIRAGIINLLQDLKLSLGLSYLFVAHDLALVRHIADRVAVMYLGRIVETGNVDDVYGNATHPYTRCLLSAMPIPDPDIERHRLRIIPVGELPGPANPPSGCHFHTRCPKKTGLNDEQQRRCVTEAPVLTQVETEGVDDFSSDRHCSACHFNALPWEPV